MFERRSRDVAPPPHNTHKWATSNRDATVTRLYTDGPMAEDRGRPALTTDEVRAFIERAPRCNVRVHVLYQPPDKEETVETQLVNLSRSGMFLASRGGLLD